MKILERIALIVCLVNVLAFVGMWNMMLLWGGIAIIPLTMIIYRKLKEKYENKI